MDTTSTVANRLDQIFEEAKRIASAAVPASFAYVAVLTALTTYVDMVGWESGGQILINIATLAAGYFLVVSMLRNSGLARDGLYGGFWTYFGIGLLTGIATLIGFLLLVVPGIILLARWAPVYGFGLVEGQGVTQAMSSAWEATEGHFWPIVAAYLIPMVIFAAGMVAYFFSFDELDAGILAGLVGANALLNLAAVAGTAVGLAIYSLLAPLRDAHLDEIFE